jgi:parallel beta-helix repeat protein
MRAQALALFVLLGALPGEARTLIVNPGDSIQAAVDAAKPGDTIEVQPGTYSASGDLAVVRVRTSGISLRASRAAVIDARGHRYGVLVGSGAPASPERCSPVGVRGFGISGFTIVDATETALLIDGVDGFSIRDGAYLGNREHGAMSSCASHGEISGNHAAGQGAAAIRISDSSHVVVEGNSVTESGIGVEIENSIYAVVRKNQIFGNTAGLLVAVRAGHFRAFTDHVRIEENAILKNNRREPVASASADPDGAIASGSGLLNAGGDHVSIERNVILDNDSFGVATTASASASADPRIDPFADRQRVEKNVILLNGQSPDPRRADIPGADIVYVPDLLDFAAGAVRKPDPDPSDVCFGENRFYTEFPAGVTGALGCP